MGDWPLREGDVVRFADGDTRRIGTVGRTDPTGFAIHWDNPYSGVANYRWEFVGRLQLVATAAPIPMRLPCPSCGVLHIDEGEFVTKIHRTHACQSCGMVWRPAVVATVGVQFLPGYANEEVHTDG